MISVECYCHTFDRAAAFLLYVCSGGEKLLSMVMHIVIKQKYEFFLPWTVLLPPNRNPISFPFPGSPNGIFFPRLCSCPTSMYCYTWYCSLLGNYKHKKCTNTNTIGTVAVAEHPYFAKHNRTAHPKLYSRGQASNFSLKTYDLRSYPQSQQINLRLLP